ncbi:hypothetical protein FXF51_57180 [Nonomuraea sp. PA05]|uniref:hypothetical protein n=1 Tax=Nonomuraea sp. PA05 TaxID=2604466 RepID=UPI0011DBE455|nr:hypothetical protein [Nonomuraea sp. PA05]TYB50077.1 hypothetical protein FXF51_57180 [Nonomuraea sp. PA05]
MSTPTRRSLRIGVLALTGTILLALTPTAPALAANTIAVNSAKKKDDTTILINVTFTCDADGPNAIQGIALKDRPNYATAVAGPITCDGKGKNANVPAKLVKGAVLNVGDQVAVQAELVRVENKKIVQRYGKARKQLTVEQAPQPSPSPSPTPTAG